MKKDKLILERQADEMLARIRHGDIYNCEPGYGGIGGNTIYAAAVAGQHAAYSKRPKFYNPEHAFDEQYRRVYDAAYARENKHQEVCPDCRRYETEV